MTQVFGVSIDTIMLALLMLLTLCLLSLVWVAWRRPVIFKLGVRGIPRRRTQSTLIVVGLMLSTLIIAASLGTGDTLNYSLTADAYNNLGHVDELVVKSQAFEAPNADTTAKIDAGAVELVQAAVKGNIHVDGVMPVLEEHVPVLNERTNLAEPDLLLTGLDPAHIDQFGGLRTEDGQPIELNAVGADGIVLSAKAAGKLEAKVGDRIMVVYNNTPTSRTVAAIAENSYLSGVRRGRGSGLELAGMVMPLADLQALTGQGGQLSAVAISNRGGVRDGEVATGVVTEALREPLAGQQLGVDPIKQRAVAKGQELSEQFAKLFLVLGLFAIATGVLLILLIFTLLAAERRYEMGMTRAVGAQRGQLVQQFVAEGAGYALLSGLVGAALGVATAGGIAAAMSALFGQYVPIVAHVTPRSLIVAYCLGVVLTFAAVVASSWKISRLNVVAAVRDLPDIVPAKRNRGLLAWSALLALLGGLLMWSGESAGEAVPFYLGLSLLPFGASLLARFFGAPGRPILTVAGLAILALWLLPTSVAE
ncbi:MAG: FtsX-like permease family protein, partial [Chloroflexota bacterium]|nr:FtsX-like permease family protein [Chloroflexota bacterium]